MGFWTWFLLAASGFFTWFGGAIASLLGTAI